MTHTPDTDEQIIIPADDVHENSTVVERPRKRRRSRILIVGGLILLGLILWSFMSAPETQTMSRVVAPPRMDTTVGGAVQQTSEEYADSLRVANDQNAEEALDAGRTFFPAPEGIPEPIEGSEESLPKTIVEDAEEPEAPAVVTRKRAVVPQLRKVNEPEEQTAPQQGAQAQEPPENPYIALIGGQMNAMSGVFVPPESSTEELNVTDETEQQAGAQPSSGALADGQPPRDYLTDAEIADIRAREAAQNPLLAAEAMPSGQSTTAQQVAAGGNQNVTDPRAAETSKVYIPAGDILYGEVLATVNSDAPMPIVATVTTGEHKGARVLGTFTTDASSRMVVQFSQMTKGDVTVPVTAVAVDGYNGDPSTRSGIDRRYLARYGSIFASTFIEGLAGGLAEPEKQILTNSDGDQQVVEEKRTHEESLWKGVEESVSAISGDITASAPKGPKVYLHAGYPLGILFLDDLRENPDAERVDGTVRP